MSADSGGPLGQMRSFRRAVGSPVQSSPVVALAERAGDAACPLRHVGSPLVGSPLVVHVRVGDHVGDGEASPTRSTRAASARTADTSTYVKGHGILQLVPKSLPLIELAGAVCCPPVAAGVVSDADALEVALRLKALADPVRIKLLSLVLAAGSAGLRNVDLVHELGLTDATVSHHLGQLSRAGLLVAAHCGTSTYYAADRLALGALARVVDPACC